MRLLHIVATPRGLASNTARISSVFLESMRERYDDLEVTMLDLFSADLPAVAGINIESKYLLMTGQLLDSSRAVSWKQIEKSIETFLAAELYLLTVPMWNFGIPYALKYYIDAIVQPGYLFRYNEQGIPEGLVRGKKMLCVTSRGGDYSPDYMKGYDFVEPYLRAVFNFVGITDMQFINAQPMDVTLELHKSAQKAAIAEARRLAAENDWRMDPDAPAAVQPAGVKPAPLTV